MDAMQYPVGDTLDLHTFLAKEIPDLLDDYFSACIEKQNFSVRIIHGKGQGFLRERVQHILKRHPLVRSFCGAPAEAGGWGATLVELKRMS